MKYNRKEVIVFVLLFCPVLVIVIRVLGATMFIRFCLFAFSLSLRDFSLSVGVSQSQIASVARGRYVFVSSVDTMLA